MTRLCVLGNSHTGALKMGWPLIASEFPGVEITFFAGRAQQTRDIRVVDGRLEAGNDALADQFAFTSGGSRAIDPAAFDVFLSYGYWSRPLAGESPAGYSKAFRRRVVADRARNELFYLQMLNLRMVTNKPVFVAQAPLPAAPPRNIPPAFLPYDEEIALLQSEICAELDAVVVPQPQETIVNGVSTRAEFSQGSQRLDAIGEQEAERHEQGERRHMNQDYGRLWLRSFMQRLG